MTGVVNQGRLLFYFTTTAQLPRLMETGQLPTDASITGLLTRLVPVRSRAGLVWLTDNAELLPEQARGAAQVRPGLRARADGLIRVTAAVSGAHYWPSWARRHL